jgi:hypothetical protein
MKKDKTNTATVKKAPVRKEQETSKFYAYVREFSKAVRTRGKTGKEIAQGAFTLASIYWVLRYYGSGSEDTKQLLRRVEHILRAAGLTITSLR